MKQTSRKPLEFKPARPGNPSAGIPDFDLQHREFLGFIAAGHSIGEAVVLVGATRAAYEKWRTRVEGFKAAVAAARESHRRDIACGLHGADAYARMLLDAIQRDDSLPASLRYRASKTILTRKGKTDWLPDPIPAESEPLPFLDNEQFAIPTGGFVLHPQRAGHAGGSASESCRQEQNCPVNANPADVLPTPHAPGTAAAAPILEARALPAPVIAAEAAQSLPENPDNPDSMNQACIEGNSLRNLQDTAAPVPLVAVSQFFTNPDSPSRAAAVFHPFPEARPASEPGASAVSAAPQSAPAAGTASRPYEDSPRKPEAALSQTWLGAHFLHQHESKPAFERLLASHVRAYAPATAPEELLVFRITQKSWLLRRVEAWERVIADSQVDQIRKEHPGAAAPACIALSLLEAGESSHTRFYERTARLRKEHEDALGRLEAKLSAMQQARAVRETREARAAEQARRPPSVRCGAAVGQMFAWLPARRAS
ncbi:MAG: hypothetical protein LC114_04065 [Bryobacterales bacterium]|nr:hypothetical protein [Bryobacterales bacterium]